MNKDKEDLIKAINASTIEEFMSLSFPDEWSGIAARILETGAILPLLPKYFE